MQSTYEMIRALPGKTTNWQRIVNALRDHYITAYTAAHGQSPWSATIDELNAAKSVRELRHAAMYAAALTVDLKAQRSSFIPPSPETLSWGGFLGGEHVVWTDDAAEAHATAQIAEIIANA